jgi:uncharacterized protein YbjT (DUF2867 family)
MSAQRKVVVFLVTGDQGLSVAKYLVKDDYKVVGLTRNPESDKAQGTFAATDTARPYTNSLLAVAALGVELVKADLDHPSSYASALDGAYGAYVNADCMCSGPGETLAMYSHH